MSPRITLDCLKPQWVNSPAIYWTFCKKSLVGEYQNGSPSTSMCIVRSVNGRKFLLYKQNIKGNWSLRIQENPIEALIEWTKSTKDLWCDTALCFIKDFTNRAIWKSLYFHFQFIWFNDVVQKWCKQKITQNSTLPYSLLYFSFWFNVSSHVVVGGIINVINLTRIHF